MKTKHTPGPWFALQVNQSEHIIQIGDSDRQIDIARVNQHHELSEIEAEANAKLIAAAPELLEALDSLMSMFSKDGTLSGHLFEICDEAIKKATS